MIAHDILDLRRRQRLHFVGVGGSGMAPFARLLAADGHAVSGADRDESANVALLRSEGIDVWTGPKADLVPPDVDAVIHTAAVPAHAAPLVAARRAELPVLKYARAVGLYAGSKETCAVAGTHGKTTTSGMLAYVLRHGGIDASFLVGGNVPQLTGPGAGRARQFVVEACEYDRSFLHLRPSHAIVTNIEADHLDYFKDIVEIRETFSAFARQVTELLVVHESLRDVVGRANGVRARVATFGSSPDADLRVLPDRRTEGGVAFLARGRPFLLQVPGWHNVLNAASVMLLAEHLGMDRDAIADGLATFAGVGRRLQVVGRPRGVPVVDDYAHHPTEVAAGLRALRDWYAPRRLWVVFQPHQYSRLRRFLPQFAEALSAADRIVVPDIYAARDGAEDRAAVSSGDLVEAVKTHGGDAVHIADFASIVDFVSTQARAGDVVVTMGAGDVGDVAGRLAAAL